MIQNIIDEFDNMYYNVIMFYNHFKEVHYD